MRITHGNMPIRTWQGRTAALRPAGPQSVHRANGLHAHTPGRRSATRDARWPRQHAGERAVGTHVRALGHVGRADPAYPVLRLPPRTASRRTYPGGTNSNAAWRTTNSPKSPISRRRPCRGASTNKTPAALLHEIITDFMKQLSAWLGRRTRPSNPVPL